MNVYFSSSIKWMMSCLFLCFTTFLQGEEKLFCPFDERSWKIGFEEQTEDLAITELVLQNEDINNWNELFTVQLFKGLPISASDFISLLEKSSKQNTPSHVTLRFQVIEADPLNIFESSFIFNQSKESTLSTIANDEYNVGRVLKGKSITYYIRYSTKEANLFKQNKEAWVKRLKLAYFASEPRANQQGRWFTFTSKGVYDQEKQLIYQTDYQLIENQEVGYSLSLPKDWKVDKLSSTSSSNSQPSYIESARFSSPDQRIQGSLAFRDLPESASMDHLNEYKKQHPQAKLIDQGTVETVLGQEATYFIFDEGEYKKWVTFMNMDQRMYRLELWTKREQFHELKSELEKIIRNFQVASALSPIEK